MNNYMVFWNWSNDKFCITNIGTLSYTIIAIPKSVLIVLQDCFRD